MSRSAGAGGADGPSTRGHLPTGLGSSVGVCRSSGGRDRGGTLAICQPAARTEFVQGRRVDHL